MTLQFKERCGLVERRLRDAVAAQGYIRCELVGPLQDVGEMAGKVQPVLHLPDREKKHRQVRQA